MKIATSPEAIHRYPSAAASHAAHLVRRAKFFPKAEPACLPVVPAEPPATLAPPISTEGTPPHGSTPLENTVPSIIGAVAAGFNLTVDAVLNDVTSSTAQMARKVAAAVVVRRLQLRPEDVAVVFDIVPGAVLDGLLVVDAALREFAIPRTSPLNTMLRLIFDNSRFDLAAPRVTIEEIKRVVARHFRVSVADLMSARRTANVVRPRQIAMAVSKRLTLKSLPEIGRRFGGRDHTTVLHAVRKFEKAVAVAADQVAVSDPVIDWVRAVDIAYEGLSTGKGTDPATAEAA